MNLGRRTCGKGSVLSTDGPSSAGIFDRDISLMGNRGGGGYRLEMEGRAPRFRMKQTKTQMAAEKMNLTGTWCWHRSLLGPVRSPKGL